MRGKRIVVFNAPIMSGKDYVVDWLIGKLPSARKMEFKTELIRMTCLIYGVTEAWWTSNYTRETKDLPRHQLNGLSMRQALIHVSEIVIKPNFGSGYFGEASRVLIDNDNESQYFLYADGGFLDEIGWVGEDYTPLLVRIHREGYEYDPTVDSRGYVTDEMLTNGYLDNWTSADIDNREGEFEEFCEEVLQTINNHFS